MPESTCSLPDCSKPTKRMGYCYGHYMKQWRYGTPTPEREPGWVDIRGAKFGTLTVISRRGQAWVCRCECGRERAASAGELNRTGDAATCGHRPTHRRQPVVGYGAAHVRIRQDRGKSSTHLCVDCGEPAQHWSYNHDDPDELLGTSGYSASPVAYSLKAGLLLAALRFLPQEVRPQPPRCSRRHLLTVSFHH